MNGESEVREQKLRDAFEYLENGNTKRALVDVNKVMKKNPSSHAAIALKALILLRSSKVSDAFQLMESLMNDYPTDRGILHMMFNFFKETRQEKKMLEYLIGAAEKFPDNEDVLLSLFFMHVRRCDFNAQQVVARKLLNKKTSDKSLQFTMAVSTMMQGENDAALAKRVFLPLAERMLEKALNEDIFESHTELQLYLTILRRQEKYSQTLEVLKNPEVIERINEKDYNHDYSNEILEIFALLNDWPNVIKSACDILLKDPDNWSAWKALLENAFQKEDCITERIKTVNDVIERFRNQSPKSRGPLLAQIDFSANLLKRRLKHHCADAKFCKKIIQDYIQIFSGKQICALDISYAVPLIIPDEKSRVQFIQSLLSEYHTKSALSVSDDVDNTNREVCMYRIARTSGAPLMLDDLIAAYQKHAGVSSTGLSNGTSGKAEASQKDMCPADGLLLLAVSELVDPLKERSAGGGQNPLGRMLLAAHWLSQVGLRHSPANHFMRLRLASILSPGGGLACVERQIRELLAVELKQILVVSLGHYVIAPGPHLTIWGCEVSAMHAGVSGSGGGGGQPKDRFLDSATSAAQLPDFYQAVMTKARSMRAEAEDWLVGAYRQQTYSQVREFAQFVERLKHADGVVLARIELLYNRVMVLSHSFDDALEKMSFATVELKCTREHLNRAIDCRDFTIVPEFSAREQEPEYQLQTFKHLRTWGHRRLDVVDLFSDCSRLVMRAVPSIDLLDSGDAVSDDLRQELTALVKTMNDKVAAIFDRVCGAEDAVTYEADKFKLTHLLLSPEALFATPPPLPAVPMTSFYFYNGADCGSAPYARALLSGIHLVTHLIALLLSSEPSLEDTGFIGVIAGLCDPLDVLIGLIVRPPEGQGVEAPLPEDINPSANLLGLGVAMETMSLVLLMVSAVVSMLRPRRMAHNAFLGKPKKNKKKQQQQRQLGDDDAAPPPAKQHSRLATSLDRLAEHLYADGLPRLEKVASSLHARASDWSNWCKCQGARAFAATARQTSKSVLSELPETDETFPWQPDVTAASGLFTDMATNLSNGFAHLADLGSQKLESICAMREEVHFKKED